MCGGLAGALGMRARASGAGGGGGALFNALGYHLGRIAGYSLAGALCGLFGAGVQAALDLSRLAVGLRVASGVLLVLVAARILLAWNTLGWLDVLGARFWRRLQPVARQAASSQGTSRSLLLGLMWGWLPCGLVYSMLMFAALSGTAANGALIMIAFGVGTLPSMLGSSLFAAQLHAWLSQRWPRLLSGVLLLIFGAWMIAAALQSSTHASGDASPHSHSSHAPPHH